MASRILAGALDPAVFWPTFWSTLIATIVGVFVGLVAERRYQKRRDQRHEEALEAERVEAERREAARMAAEHAVAAERHDLLTDYGTTITILYDLRDLGDQASRYFRGRDSHGAPPDGMKFASRALRVAIEENLVPRHMRTSYAFLYSSSSRLEDRVEQTLRGGMPDALWLDSEIIADQVARWSRTLIDVLSRRGTDDSHLLLE